MLVLGSPVYFFDALPSAQCVDRPAVHARMTVIGLSAIKGWIDAIGSSEANVASPRSLPPVRPNKGSLREEYLAAFGFSDCRPPFLAAAKLPSINVRHTHNQVPSSSQRRHRGPHADGLGYLSGKSGQPAPERQSQRMPSNS